MALAGNPRKHAADIGAGYVLLTPVLLRGLAVAEIRALKQALELELRDTRGEGAAASDLEAVQVRQRRMLRLNQALLVIRSFALKRRLTG